MAQVGGLCGKLICYIKVKLHACLMSYSRQMQHGIGGAAQRHIYGKCVHECLLRHDIAGSYILLYQFHYLHSGVLCQTDTFGINSGNGTVALKAHAQSFGKAVH